MKARFTYRDLYDSGSIYAPILDVLNELIIKLNPEQELDYMKGYTNYSVLLHNVIAYNRCFWQLAKAGEVYTAYPLIRLQADNVRVLVTEYLYPNQILSAVYDNGKELNQIKAEQGKTLSNFELNEKTKSLYTRFLDIVHLYNQFAHPSKKHNLSWFNKQNKNEEAREMRRAHKTIKRTVGEWDMVYLNQCIIHTLLLIKDRTIKALGGKGVKENDLIRSHPDFIRAEKEKEPDLT